MYPQTTNIHDFSVTYLNKEELGILKKEIFDNRIYDIDLNTDKPRILDVGAHIGLATLFFKMKYPFANITSFEPNPNVFPILEENIEINGLKNVEIKNIALGSKDCIKDLHIDSSGEGAFSTASFLKDAWNGKQKSLPIQVAVEDIGKYVDEDIDLLKLDTEGSELEIVKHLDEERKIGNIKNLIIEYHPRKNHKISMLTHILEKNGFELTYIHEGKEIAQPIEELILVVAKKSI